MAVLNGMIANQTTFNNAFLSRTASVTSTVAQLQLNNPNSTAVDDAQKYIGKLAEAVGITEVSTDDTDYANQNYIVNSEPYKSSIERLDAQLKLTQDQLDAVDTANTQDVSGAVIGNTPNAQGFTLNGQVLNLEPASALFGGVVTTAAQSFAGDKTFLGNVVIAGNIEVQGTRTFANTQTVESLDTNITLNKGGTNATAEGGGFEVERVTGGNFSAIFDSTLASIFKVGIVGAEREVVVSGVAQTIAGDKTFSGNISAANLSGTNTGDVTLAPIGNTPNANGATLTGQVLTLQPASTSFGGIVTTGAQSFEGDKTFKLDQPAYKVQGATPTNPPSSYYKLYPKTDGFYFLDSLGVETKVGSGAGTGGGFVNLITNGDGEASATSPFVPYLNAASSRPVTGAGGSPSVTTSTTITSPLSGTRSILLTKPAGNLQGQGWSAPFDVALDYRAKALQIDISYIVNSGSFAAGTASTDSDVIFYLYDISNSTLIEPSSFKLLSNSSTLSDKYRATFQTSATGAQYRLIAHIATTTANAFELKIEAAVNPSVYVYGTPSVDLPTYTPTFSNLGTVTGLEIKAARQGSYLILDGRFNNGTVGAGAATFTLPAGLVGDYVNATVVGDYGHQGSATGSCLVYDPANNTLFFGMANWQVQATGTQMATGGFTSFNCRIKIQGWSAATQMADGFEGRDISARYYLTSAQSIPDNNATVVIWNAKDYDTVNGMNTSNGRYTALSSGYYDFKGAIGLTVSINIIAGNRMSINYRINGGTPRQLVNENYQGSTFETFGYSFSDRVWLNAGDYIEILIYLDFGGASYNIGSSNGGVTYFVIKKDNSAQTISASEKIRAKYGCNTGQVIPSSVQTTLIFNVKKYDTHGIYNASTGIFTLPRAGFGQIKAAMIYTSASFAGGYLNTIAVYKNGVAYGFMDYRFFSTSTGETGASGSCDIEGVAGDQFSVRVSQNATASRAVYSGSAATEYNYVDFILD